MATSLRELIPGYNPATGLSDLIPGYAPPAVAPATLRAPEVQGEYDRIAAGDMSELGKGFRSTRMGLDASYDAARVSSLRRMGQTAEADQIQARANETQRRAEAYAPSEPEATGLQWNPTKDGFSLPRIGNFAAGVVGGAAGSMVDSLGTGAAAGLAARAVGLFPHPLTKAIGAAAPFFGPGAAAVPNVLQAKGSTYQAMQDDPALMARTTAEERDNTAWGAGLAQGAVDTVLPGMFINRALGSGLRKGISKMATPTAVGLESLGSGAEEYAQDRMEKAALTYLNPDRDTSGDTNDSINNFVAGLTGVAPMSAASHMIDKGYRRLGTEGDGKNGDAIPLNEKPTLDSDLAGKSKQAFSDPEQIVKHHDFLMGSIPDENQGDALNWAIDNGPRRKDALLAELAKNPNDPESKAHIQALMSAEPISLTNPLPEEYDDAAEYVVKKNGIESAVAKIEIAKAAATKNKVKNSMEGVGVMQEPSVSNVGGAGTLDSVEKGPTKPGRAEHDEAKRKLQVKLANDVLTYKAAQNGHTNAADLIDNLSEEIVAMGQHDKANPPTRGELSRAKRVGTTIAHLVGSDVAMDVMNHLDRTNQLGGSFTFKAARDGVDEKSTPVAERHTAADELVSIIPPDVQSHLIKKGIDLTTVAARERLLTNMEDFADGVSDFARGPAERLFGKETFDAMLEHVGTPIMQRERVAEEVGSQGEESGERTALSSDGEDRNDEGGEKFSERDLGESDSDAFEKRMEEKSLDRVDPEAFVFHHSTKDTGVVTEAKDAWNGTPRLIKLDTDTNKRDSETVEAHAARTAPGGAVRMFNARKYLLVRKARRALGSLRDKFKVNVISAKDLMDRQNVQPGKRAALFHKYLDQEKHPNAEGLQNMFSVVQKLGYIRQELDDIVARRESVSPSGKKLSVAQGAEIIAPKINYEKLADLAATPEDREKVLELFKSKTAAKYIGLARIAARAHKEAVKQLGKEPGFAEFVGKSDPTHTPSFDDFVNDFFANRHLVLADSGTNRDHLQLGLAEFRRMASKGAANLKSARLPILGSDLSNDLRAKEIARIEASMNLIRFTSKHSKTEDQQIALPAYMLVKWVRVMRNAHEVEVVPGKSGDVRGDNHSPSRQAEDYRRDLLEGITAAMQNGLTEGLPYIINAAGNREDFVAYGDSPRDVPTNRSAPQQKRKPGSRSVSQHHQHEMFPLRGVGELPPSLDLDGTKNRNHDLPPPPRNVEGGFLGFVKGLRATDEKDETRAVELSAEPTDLQTTEQIERSEDETDGSKKDTAEREHLGMMTRVLKAAADAAPRSLTVGQAFNRAAKVAESLWRDFADRTTGTETKHEAALARILAYVMSIDRPTYSEDKSVLLGGKHYVAPLAALLTPRHMATIEALFPADARMMTMLRSRVAWTLLDMAAGKHITGANMTKMVNFLSGKVDMTEQTRIDKASPVDADIKKERLPWGAQQVPVKQQKAFLTEMAKDYTELLAKRAANKVSKPVVEVTDRSGTLPKFTKNATVLSGPTTPSNPVLDSAKRAEAKREALMAERAALNVEVRNLLTDADAWAVGGFVTPLAEHHTIATRIEELRKQINKITDKLEARVPAKPLAAVTSGGDKYKDIGTTLRSPLISRKGKEAPDLVGPAPESAGVGPKITINQRKAAREKAAAAETRGLGRSARTTDVAADTASVEADNDNLVKALDDAVVSAQAKPVVAKSEAAKPNILETAISKRQDYLDNPPEDYSTEGVSAILEWAIAQQKRVMAELKKLDLDRDDPAFESDRYDEVDDLEYSLRSLMKDAKDQLQNDKDMAEADIKNGTNLFGGNPDVKFNEQAVDAAGTKTGRLEGWKQGPTAEANKSVPMGEAAMPLDKDIFLAKTYIGKVLGPKVTALFEKAFPDMAGSAEWSNAKQMIRIATGSPVSVMQRAYHEAMHGFFSNILKNHPETREMLERAMATPEVVRRLEYLLKDSPKALAALADPEERVAYAFQFWAANMLSVGTQPKTLFQKVQAFLRKVLGEVRDSDKALAIFQAFHDGKLAEPSEAGKAIAKVMATGEWQAKFMKRWDKQAQAVYSEVMTAHDVLRTSESPLLQALSTTWWANPADPGSAGKTGVIDRRGIKTNQYESRFHSILDRFSGENQERDLEALVGYMNGDKSEVMPEIAKAGEALRALTAHVREYATSAGVKMGERDDGKFWPVIWDLEKMVESKDAFVEMLLKNYESNLTSALDSITKVNPAVSSLKEVAEAIHQIIIDRGGVDEGGLEAHREDGILNPYFASQNKRNFDWIADDKRQPFLSTDIVATGTRYLHQAVRSAEYVRAFGEGGNKLKDMMAKEGDVQITHADGTQTKYLEDGPVVKELKAEAAKQKITGKDADMWVARRMEDAQRAMGAMEGVLGKDISVGMRKFQSVAMVYQGLRLLTLSIFSAMLDPNGIRVAGGTNQNMLDAYVHGLKNVVLTWKDILVGDQLKTRGNDDDLKNAATVGAIAPTMFLEGMGAAHTSEYTAGAARKINRGLFLANGLTAWDRSMRIMAVKAAMESIANSERNTSPEHSKRWLKDLGLEQGSVTLDTEGRLVVDKNVLKALRPTHDDKQATEEINRVHVAVNRWVNRAIVSPNAAQRPTRASDPHYAMFYQLKQFTYSFQKTTMLYALNEAEAGNMAPSVALLGGVPIMLAADITKAVITGGGSLPGYMANWTLADWLMHSWNRAGLNGIGQFGIDALHDPLGTLGGPTVGQAVDLVTQPIGETLVEAVPVINKVSGLAHAVGRD